MDDFQKANLKEHDGYDIDCRNFLSLSREFTKWAKRKSNHIARQRLKDELKQETYVVHAHWIHKYNYDGIAHTVCSACLSDKYGYIDSPICKNCGAVMDEEDKE